VRTAFELNHSDAAITIVKALAVDSDYFGARGHTQLSLRLLDQTIAAVEDRDPTTLHFLLARLGDYQSRIIADFPAAHGSYKRSLAHAPDDKRRAILLSAVAMISHRLDRPDTGLLFDQAYEIACRTNDDHTLATVLEQRGFYAYVTADWHTARQLIGESLTVVERMMDNSNHVSLELVKRQFFALHNLAQVEHELGNYESSLELEERALTIATQQANQLWIGYAFESKGENLHFLNDQDQALAYFLEALKTFEQVNAEANIASVRNTMSKLGYQEVQG
jgi:tetratricopeptide (TPR) repeat protein